MIRRAVMALSSEEAEDTLRDRINGAVHEIIRVREYLDAPLMKKAFIMMDRLSVQGIRFPKDLLLFRKSFFTLDGLLHDLDPEFDMDQAVMAYMRDLLIGELPHRLAAFLVPIGDTPECYRSLLSNKDLQMLLICQAMDCIRKNADMVKEFIEKNSGLMNSLFCLPMFFTARFAKVLLGLYYLFRLGGSAAF